MRIIGDFDVEKFRDNIRAAIHEYISHVDGTPAMKTGIKLYPGVEESLFKDRRANLLTFLKGSKKSRSDLQV